MALVLLLLSGSAFAKGFLQQDLVSNLSGVALHTDSALINAWGIDFNAAGTVLWVADNGTGVATLYDPDGTPRSLVVTIPLPASVTGPAVAAPTGLIRNDTDDFVVASGSVSGASRFLFATEDGTISGWNPNVDPDDAMLAVDRSANDSVYKGLAIAEHEGANFLYATDFHNGLVDVFDAGFNFLGSFTDPDLPSDFAPFGIKNIGGNLFVTYAKQNAEKHDDVPGLGNGFVVIFDPDGSVLSVFAEGGTLNSPWGMEIAPQGFDRLTGALLVGNFGNGHINAFDLETGEFLGQLIDRTGSQVEIEGLWGLKVRPGSHGGNDQHGTMLLYFSAGPNDEADGLLGTLRLAPAYGLFRSQSPAARSAGPSVRDLRR